MGVQYIVASCDRGQNSIDIKIVRTLARVTVPIAGIDQVVPGVGLNDVVVAVVATVAGASST